MAHQFIDGKNNPFGGLGLPISKGELTGHSTVHKFGANAAVGTSELTLWTGATGLYTYPGSAMVMKISSTDVDDTAGDTGAIDVTVYGVDSGYVEINEKVTLNGRTPVNTTKQFLRVYRMKVNSAGTTGSNEGTLWAGTGTVTTGVPAEKFGQIAVGENQSLMAMYTIPAGHTAYMHSLSASATKGKGSTVKLFARPLGEVFQLKMKHEVYQTVADLHFPMPRKFAEKTDLEIRAVADAGSTVIDAEFDMTLVQEI